MERNELATRLARRSHISKAQAADQLDAAVHQILSKLRSGKEVPVPGLGVLVPGAKPKLRQVPKPPSNKRGRRGGR